MTKVRAIVDGKKVKFTLEQLEQSNPTRVRVDWLRFTLPVDSVVPHVSPDLSWAVSCMATDQDWDTYRGLVPQRLALEVLRVDGAEFYMTPKALAFVGHAHLAEHLPQFPIISGVHSEDSGMDFYAARRPLVFEGSVVGYVLAGGRSAQQANTIHYNLFGSACLHMTPGQLCALAGWIESMGGWITRCDLALDVWDGLDVTEVQAAWRDGLFDVRGKRPGQREMGSWSCGHSRTFEVGNRGTGKLLRAYEKGDELFGPDANDPWVRLEVEFRNNHRVIEPDVLRRPADYFAGAYQYLADFLARADVEHEALRIPTHPEVADKTAEAAVVRLVRWLNNTAAPAIGAAFQMGGDLLAELIQSNQHREARRLHGFGREAIQKAFDQVAAALAPPVAPIAHGA